MIPAGETIHVVGQAGAPNAFKLKCDSIKAEISIEVEGVPIDSRVRALLYKLGAEFFKSIALEERRSKSYKPISLSLILNQEGIFDKIHPLRRICPKSLPTSDGYKSFKELFKSIFHTKFMEVAEKKEPIRARATRSQEPIPAIRDKGFEILGRGIGAAELEASRIKSGESYFTETYTVDEGFFEKNQWQKAIPTKLFGHIHGDIFLTETGLEGENQREVMSYISTFIKEKVLPKKQFSEKGNAALKEMAQSLDKGLKLSFPTTKIPHNKFKKVVKEFSEKFKHDLNVLPIGKSLVLEGGWIAIPRGHAIYIKVTKTSPTQVEMRVFNKGEGVELYHEKKQKEGEILCFPKVTIREIPLNKLTASSFARAFFEMNTLTDYITGPSDWGGRTRFDEKTIYEHWLPFLGGKVQTGPDKEDFSQLCPPQHSGICSWASMEAYIQDSLSPKDYARFLYEVQRQSLIDMQAKNRDLYKLKDSTDEILLIKKSAEQFARTLSDRFEKGVISRVEMELGIEMAHKILHHAEQAKKLHEDEVYTIKAATVSLNAVPQASYKSFPAVKPVIVNKEVRGVLKIPKLTQPIPIPAIRAETLDKDLTDFFTQCQLSFKKGNDRETIVAINQLFSALPIPKIAHDDFWKGLEGKKSQALSCMKAISNLTELLSLTYSHFNMDSLPCQHAENTLQAMKGLAIQKRLAEISGEFPLLRWKMPSEAYRTCYFGGSGPSNKGDQNLYNAKQRLDCKMILDYLKGGEIAMFSNLYEPNKKVELDAEKSLVSDAFNIVDEEQRFIHDYCEKPENQKKFLEAFPDFAKINHGAYVNSKHGRVAMALTDLSGKFLPESFCFLKKQALYCNYMVEGIVGLPIALSVDKPESVEKEKWKVSNKDFNVNIQSRILPSRPGENEPFTHGTDPIQRPVLKAILNNYQPFSQIHSPYGLLSWENRLPLDEVRELVSLSVFGNDDNRKVYPQELQVQKSLSYFASHLPKLDDPDYQAFFKNLFFKNDYLAKYLEKNPEFSLSICDFIEKGYSHFRLHKNIVGAAFFLKLSELIREEFEIHAAIPECPPQIKVALAALEKSFNVLEKIEEIKSICKSEEKSLIYQVELYRFSQSTTPLTDQEMVKVFHMLAHCKQFPSKFASDRYVNGEIEKMRHKILPDLLNRVRNRKVQGVFEGVLSVFFDNVPKNLQWDITKLPLCICTNADYIIDLTTLSVISKNLKLMSSLPESILGSFRFYDVNAVSKLLENVPKTITSPWKGAYEFTDTDGIPTRIIQLPEKAFIYKQLKKDGRWYQFLTYEDLGNEKIFGKYQYDHKNKWVSCDDHKKMILTDVAKATHEVQIDKDNTFNISPIDKPEWRLLNNEQLKNDYQFLQSFENKESYDIWVNAKGEPQCIEFPRLQLQFQVKDKNGQKVAECLEMPGFYLARHQRVAGMGDCKNFLLLENDAGQQKVILIKGKIDVGKGALQTQVAIIPPEVGIEKADFYVYDVDRTGNLHSLESEKNLFLAYILFQRKDYEQAQAVLRTRALKLSEYTPNEKAIFELLFSSHEESKNRDPKASAAFLTAVAAKRLNEGNYGKGFEMLTETLKTAYKSYIDYLKKIEHATYLGISVEEEKMILQMILAAFKNPDMREKLEQSLGKKSYAFETLNNRLLTLAGINTQEIEWGTLNMTNSYLSVKYSYDAKSEYLKNSIKSVIDGYEPRIYDMVFTPYPPDYKEIYRKATTLGEKEREELILEMQLGMFARHNADFESAFFIAVAQNPTHFPPYKEFLRILSDESEKGLKEFEERVYKPYQKLFVEPRKPHVQAQTASEEVLEFDAFKKRVIEEAEKAKKTDNVIAGLAKFKEIPSSATDAEKKPITQIVAKVEKSERSATPVSTGSDRSKTPPLSARAISPKLPELHPLREAAQDAVPRESIVVSSAVSNILQRFGRLQSSFGRLFALRKDVASEVFSKEAEGALLNLMAQNGSQGLALREEQSFNDELLAIKENGEKLQKLESDIVLLARTLMNIPPEKGFSKEKIIDLFLSGSLRQAVAKASGAKTEKIKQFEDLLTEYIILVRDAGVSNPFSLKRGYSKEAVREDLLSLKRDLNIQSVELKKLKKMDEINILSLVNKKQETVKSLKYQSELIGTKIARLTIPDVLRLFLRNATLFEFKEYNPNLEVEDIQKLYQLTTSFLLRGTEEQSMQRSLNALENLENYLSIDTDRNILALANHKLPKDLLDIKGVGTLLAKGIEDFRRVNPHITQEQFAELKKMMANRGENDPVLKELSNELANQLLVARSYDPSKNIRYLIFEYYSEMMLRKDQVKNLEKMLEDPPQEFVLRSIMGSGKSKVWMPIIALSRADGIHLPVVVVPESLYETSANDLLLLSRELFQQNVQTMAFDRSTEFSFISLTETLVRLETIIKEKQCLIMTSKSLQCLSLKYQELLKKFQKDGSHYSEILLFQKILRMFKEGSAIIDEADLILNSRQEVNFTVGDPVSLNPNRYQLCHDIFLTAVTSPEVQKRMNLGLTSIPLYSGEPKPSPFTLEQYHKEIKPIILNEYIANVMKKPSGDQLKEFFEKLRKEDRNQEMEEIKKYLLEDKEANEKCVSSITDAEVRNLLALMKEQLNKLLPLTLSKTCHVHFGPSVKPTAKKRKDQVVNILSPLAIPYKGNNNPVHSSQFGNPYELINYTIQMYLKTGLGVQQVEEEILKLQQQFQAEKTRNPTVPDAETAAMKAFMWLCGKDAGKYSLLNFSKGEAQRIAQNLNLVQENEIKPHILRLIEGYKKEKSAPTFNLQTSAANQEFLKEYGQAQGMNLSDLVPPDTLSDAHAAAYIESKLTQLMQKINASRLPRLMEYLNRYVLTEVKIHTEKLTSNSQDIVEMFGTVQGFTGTPWNAVTYHERLQAGTKEALIASRGTDGKTATILWKNSRNAIHRVAASQYPKVLDEMLRICFQTESNAIIDSSSFFTGVSNLSAAKQILDKLPAKYEGIVFYDESNNIVILERGKNVPTPLNASSLKSSPQKYFTYYDQSHTTGSDIKQHPLAKAVITIGKDLTMRDLFQGAWRLRGLDKSQKVSFAVSPETVKTIQRTLELEESTEITFNHILKFVFLNQLKQEQEQLELSNAKQKIYHIAKKTIINKLLELDFTNIRYDVFTDFLKQIDSILSTKLEDAPYDAFGNKETFPPTETVLKNIIETVLIKIDKIPDSSILFEEHEKTEFKKLIEEEIWKVVHKELLPNKLSSNLMGKRQGDQSEVLTEMETEAESEKQVEVQKEQYIQNAFQTPRLHWNRWAEDTGVKDKDIFQKDFWGKRYKDIAIGDIREGSIPSPSINERISYRSNLKKFAGIFDEGLLATCNFLPVKGTMFQQVQLPSQHLLLIKDKDSIRAAFLDHGGDVGFLYDRLTENRLTKIDPAEKNVELCLYDMKNGVVQRSNLNSETQNPFTEEALQKNAQFQRLIVQAKFYMGEIHYTNAEKALLSQWIKEKGASKMEELFTLILQAHPENRSLYPNSGIKPLFKEGVAKASQKRQA